ncbi:MAG: hypothetical protein ACTIJ6_11440 [Leucobacter sp.]
MTRGYVVGLIAATLILAASLVVASWGSIGIALDRAPISTRGIELWFGIITVGGGLVLLGILLWRQALAMLRGSATPAWGIIVGAAFGAYLIWCLFGVLGGLSIDETWVSPFAIVLAPIWAICASVFWLVLARRIFTDRPTPKWPWERRDEERE